MHLPVAPRSGTHCSFSTHSSSNSSAICRESRAVTLMFRHSAYPIHSPSFRHFPLACWNPGLHSHVLLCGAHCAFAGAHSASVTHAASMLATHWPSWKMWFFLQAHNWFWHSLLCSRCSHSAASVHNEPRSVLGTHNWVVSLYSACALQWQSCGKTSGPGHAAAPYGEHTLGS